MNKEEKDQVIEALVAKLSETKNFYLTDTSSLTVEKTNNLRRLCFKRNIELKVVKNTLLKKAFDRLDLDYSPLYGILKGSTAEESFYIGDNQLDALISIKTKNEVIGEIIGLLQSPAQNVISALQSGGGKIAGIVKTLSERNA
jgi:large subunit ribosomal protein L10